MDLEAGQSWAFRAPPELAHSRLIIGAIVTFPSGERLVCCAVTAAYQRNPGGEVMAAAVPFLPLGEAAFRETATALDGRAALPEAFAAGLAAWREDPRGLSYFTVPFEGSLDLLIARQMAIIVERS